MVDESKNGIDSSKSSFGKDSYSFPINLGIIILSPSFIASNGVLGFKSINSLIEKPVLSDISFMLSFFPTWYLPLIGTVKNALKGLYKSFEVFFQES